MSQPVDNVLKGCGKELEQFSFVESEDNCNSKEKCPSCKSKMQGMIEILEDELKWLELNFEKMLCNKYFTNHQVNAICFREKEIQSDLIKLKEGTK